jgi:hypothetical protein
MTRYYLDTEFIEDGKTIDLLSIGIVAEDGREFYALNRDCDWSRASDWVKGNVLALLPPKPAPDLPDYACEGHWLSHSQIGPAVKRFLQQQDSPEIWAYYADYDWVAFCQLFGTMMDLPAGFPMYCRDLQQEADRLGVDLSKLPQTDEHHALADARWTKIAHEYLMKYEDA